jgi:hypothetical protein
LIRAKTQPIVDERFDPPDPVEEVLSSLASQPPGFQDNDPLISALQGAERAGYTGDIIARGGPHLEGLVTFHEGRLAWASSSEQFEDLGSSLWRMGKISREQLSEIRERYDQSHGSHLLGTLLAEEGLIRRPVLRRCLLTHIRMALTSILSWPEIGLVRSPGYRVVDEGMTFCLDELLPELATLDDPPIIIPPRESVIKWTERTSKNEPLARFAEIGGYLGVAVVTGEGEVLMAHSHWPGLEPGTIALWLASTLETAERTTRAANMGSESCLQIDTASGCMVATWLDRNTGIIAFVLLGPGADVEKAKQVLRAEAMAVVTSVTA